MSCLKIFSAAGAMIALASCAPTARLELGRSGNVPDPGGIAVSSDTAVPPQFEAMIVEGLKKHGFILSDRPSYRLQLSLSQLQGKVGLFAPDAQEKAVGGWTMSPARSRTTTTVRATINLTDAASGRELFHAYANERSRGGTAGRGERLAEALVNQLQDPWIDRMLGRSEEGG